MDRGCPELDQTDFSVAELSGQIFAGSIAADRSTICPTDPDRWTRLSPYLSKRSQTRTNLRQRSTGPEQRLGRLEANSRNYK